MSKFNKIIFSLVVVFIIVIAGLIAPKLVIRDAPLEAKDIACAKRDANLLFDNPFDRLLIIEMSVVRKEGDIIRVNAYTFGGLKYAEAEIVCDDEARVIWRRWFKSPEVVCTMEAKICPDGSAVGRIPPTCEFAPCPGEKDICEDRCGDEICQEVVCMAIGCPCPETPEACPEDCKQATGKCGIENCHGLDIACGPNIPETCDMMYAAGDNCRQYASCQTMNGQCQLVKTQKFDDCKSCVEKCEQNFKDDQINFFQCESKCTE